MRRRALQRWWAPIKRRAPVLVTVLVLVPLAAYLVAGLRSASYTGEAIMLVPSGARGGDPGRADEAVKLAATYALAIPQDARIRAAVAAKLGVTTKTARKRMSVVNDADTAILRLRYTDASRSTAVAGANAMMQTVLSRRAWRTIRRGSLVSVRPPDQPSSKDVGTATPVAIGLIAAVFLAGMLLLGLERSDPRIDDLQQLDAEADCPISTVDEGATVLVPVVERWLQLAGRPTPRVALLPCTPRVTRRVRDLAVQLEDVARDDGAQLVVRPGGVPGVGGAGELVAVKADLTVLVVAEGTRVTELRRAVATLAQFGIAPAWMFLVRATNPRVRPAVAAAGNTTVTERGPAEA